MADGWLLLHRKIQDNPLWRDKPFSRGQAWVDLLISASHTDHSFWVRGIEVKVGPGQVAMSELTMSDRWGWSRGKTRRFLSYLEVESQIVQQKSKVTTLITIVNWKPYQGNSTTDGQQKDNRRTTDGTQSKNVKELNNEKEVDKPLSPGKPDVCPHQKIIDAYHQILPDLPRVNVWSDSSKKNLRARWREDKQRQSIAWWKDYFQVISESDFLTGKAGDWRASLSWLVGPKNFEKVINGNYANRSKQSFGGDW